MITFVHNIIHLTVSLYNLILNNGCVQWCACQIPELLTAGPVNSVSHLQLATGLGGP